MKIPGLIEINTDLSHNDIKECKVLNLTFSDPHVPYIISELGLIREIRYFKALFKSVLKELEIEENDNVAIVSSSVKELIFNLSIICAIQNQNIEYVNQEMFYTGPLRRNTHISDTTAQDYELNVDIVDDEDVFYEDDFNLENYDLDDLED
jgi:hypothetical protein